MSTIPKVAQALSVLLNSTADAAARRANFVHRRADQRRAGQTGLGPLFHRVERFAAIPGELRS